MKSIKILLVAQENSNVRHTHTHTNTHVAAHVTLTPPSLSSRRLQAPSPSHHATCKPLRMRSSQSTGDVSAAYQSSEPRGRQLSTGAHRSCCFCSRPHSTPRSLHPFFFFFHCSLLLWLPFFASVPLPFPAHTRHMMPAGQQPIRLQQAISGGPLARFRFFSSLEPSITRRPFRAAGSKY